MMQEAQTIITHSAFASPEHLQSFTEQLLVNTASITTHQLHTGDRTRWIKAREVLFIVILSTGKATKNNALCKTDSERWLPSMHVTGKSRGKYLIIFAKTKVLGCILERFFCCCLKKALRVWKACHTHSYCGINNALSNLQPWPGSSRSKPTKKTCTVKKKEKGRQREKATDKQMQRTRTSIPSASEAVPSLHAVLGWDFNQGQHFQPIPSNETIPFETESSSS